jgi:hypothetical protein
MSFWCPLWTGFGIDLFEQPPEGPLTGHVLFSGPAWAGTAAQVSALSVIEALDKFGNRVRPFATRRHRQSDEGQATGQLME